MAKHGGEDTIGPPKPGPKPPHGRAAVVSDPNWRPVAARTRARVLGVKRPRVMCDVVLPPSPLQRVASGRVATSFVSDER